MSLLVMLTAVAFAQGWDPVPAEEPEEDVEEGSPLDDSDGALLWESSPSAAEPEIDPVWSPPTLAPAPTPAPAPAPAPGPALAVDPVWASEPIPSAPASTWATPAPEPVPVTPAPAPPPPIPVPIPTVMSRPECLASLPNRTPGDRLFATRWDPARRYCERSGVAWTVVEETPALRLDPYLEGGLLVGSAGALALSTFALRPLALSARLEDGASPGHWGGTSRAPLGVFPRAEGASDALLVISEAAILLPLFTSRGDSRGTHSLILAETVLASAALQQLAATTFGRARPYTRADWSDRDAWSIEEVGELMDGLQSSESEVSFWSGHTASVASVGFGLATIYVMEGGVSDWRPCVFSYGAATAAALTQGALRVGAGKHYASDVLVGAVMGAGVGFAVPWLHRDRGAPAPWRVYASLDGVELARAW